MCSMSLSCVTVCLANCGNDVASANRTLSMLSEEHNTSNAAFNTEYPSVEVRCIYKQTAKPISLFPAVLNVRNGEVSPIADSASNTHAALRDNTFTGLNVIELYHELNGNGVVGVKTEYVSDLEFDIAGLRQAHGLVHDVIAS